MKVEGEEKEIGNDGRNENIIIIKRRRRIMTQKKSRIRMRCKEEGREIKGRKGEERKEKERERERTR